MLADEKVQAGMTPEEARRAAMIELGGIEVVKDQVRDVRAGAFLDTFAQDVRYAVRLLARNPLFALTAALSLAIGIGANTTIFTIANGLLFRAPTAVAEPHRLVDIDRARGRMHFAPIEYDTFLEIRRRTVTLTDVYGYQPVAEAMSLSGPNGAERVFGSYVTSNYFSVLGVIPAAGRLFFPTDDQDPGDSPDRRLEPRPVDAPLQSGPAGRRTDPSASAATPSPSSASRPKDSRARASSTPISGCRSAWRASRQRMRHAASRERRPRARTRRVRSGAIARADAGRTLEARCHGGAGRRRIRRARPHAGRR